MEVQCRKEYVSVNLDVDQNGVVHPRFIRWTNGRIYQIDPAEVQVQSRFFPGERRWNPIYCHDPR